MNKIAFKVVLRGGANSGRCGGGRMKKFEDSGKAVEWSTPEEKNTTTEGSKVRGRGDCGWGARKKELLLDMSQEHPHHKARAMVFVVIRLRHQNYIIDSLQVLPMIVT